MKINLKTVAVIYSLNKPAEVTITEVVGNNKYLAEYKGKVCAAMFNPFSGTFYVDDARGISAENFADVMDDVQFELNYLCESSQRELSVYKSIGSAKSFKRLKEAEIRRNKRWNLFKKVATAIILCSGVMCCIWVFVSGVLSVVA